MFQVAFDPIIKATSQFRYSHRLVLLTTIFYKIRPNPLNVNENTITMRGPATFVFSGEISGK